MPWLVSSDSRALITCKAQAGIEMAMLANIKMLNKMPIRIHFLKALA